MSFEGVQINKTDGNLGRLPANTDRVVALVAGGVAVTDKAQLNTPYRLLSVADAEAIGINAAYDANNNLMVYDHIKECFRLNPNAEIILNLVARPTTSLAALFDDAGVIEAFLRKEEASAVKYVFVAWNPHADFTPAFTSNGACTQVLAAITPAQTMVTKFFNEFRYLDGVMLDGLAIDTISSLQNLRTSYTAPNVSVLIAADAYAVANLEPHAAIGAAMGMLTIRQINENLGSVEILNRPPAFAGKENYPLDNGTRWTSAHILNKGKVSALPMATQKDLTTKGYIFAASFAGYEGIYFSGDDTCTPIAGDYAFINNNCVWNKAARLTREALIPKVRSILKKDPTTGFLRPTTAAALESLGQKKLDTMVAGNLVSAAKIYINPEQTPSDQVPLLAEVQVVKDGILHTFNVNLGLFNNITI